MTDSFFYYHALGISFIPIGSICSAICGIVGGGTIGIIRGGICSVICRICRICRICGVIGAIIYVVGGIGCIIRFGTVSSTIKSISISTLGTNRDSSTGLTISSLTERIQVDDLISGDNDELVGSFAKLHGCKVAGQSGNSFLQSKSIGGLIKGVCFEGSGLSSYCYPPIRVDDHGSHIDGGADRIHQLVLVAGVFFQGLQRAILVSHEQILLIICEVHSIDFIREGESLKEGEGWRGGSVIDVYFFIFTSSSHSIS